MAKKLYFSEYDDDNCYNLTYHREYMKDNLIDEMILIEAKRETGTGYFFCKEYGEISEVNGSCGYCGMACSFYKPLNGKSGRCKHYGWCYEPTDNQFVLKVGKKLRRLHAKQKNDN